MRTLLVGVGGVFLLATGAGALAPLESGHSVIDAVPPDTDVHHALLRQSGNLPNYRATPVDRALTYSFRLL